MKTPFQELMERPAEFKRLKAQLFIVARRHYLRGADAEDAISDAFRIGFQRELAGQPWDPKVEKAIERFASILGGIIANKRRGGRRKPTRLGLEEDDDAVSESANADELLLEVEDEAARTAQGDKLRARLAKQTDANGLTLRVIDACRDGISGHADLATHLGCSQADVRAALARITYRTRRLRPNKPTGGP